MRYSLLFGVPFVLLLVAAPYGLTNFTQMWYDLHGQEVKQVTQEESLRLDKDRLKFDIREEYFKLSAAADEEWEPKRIRLQKASQNGEFLLQSLRQRRRRTRSPASET